MLISTEVCERARLAKDPRFDGTFYIGVVTTGIYCRAVCPAPSPKAANVVYFSTAAAAATKGFRPCLRCRPEAAPGSPARQGTGATVSRALKLIGEGALDAGSVDQLAARLGIGARHLRRLFDTYLGASPRAVQQTRRLLFAGKLIRETSLPMGQVALASGFGSVRRFNDAFKAHYRRPPSSMRRKPLPFGEGGFCTQLAYRPPFDWEELLAFLRFRAIPGIEAVDKVSYSRTVVMDGVAGSLRLTHQEDTRTLLLELDVPEPALFLGMVERVRRLCDLDADMATINDLLGADATLAKWIRARPGMRVPGAWDGFECAVWAILGQQISVKAARTLATRLVARFGIPFESGKKPGLSAHFPRPETLAEADLTVIGLPKARARTISGVAAAVAEGRVGFHSEQSLEEFVANWTALKGIGDWTAQYIAMRAMNLPDAFPAGDLVIRKVLGHPHEPLTTPAALARSASWRPWRAYAVLHLWRASESIFANGE